MHLKPRKRTAARLTFRGNWKSCLPAKTKARTRIPAPFLQPSCVLLSRFEARELVQNFQAKLLKEFRKSRTDRRCRGVNASLESRRCRLIAAASKLRCR